MNQFVWTDLSSYHPKESISFYRNVFGWSFYEENGYWLVLNNKIPIAGIYETPLFFKKIKMPHFWMNYLKVKNVQETVEASKNLKAIIEITEDDFFDGQIALIRDPQGAGFTIYDGKNLEGFVKNSPGNLISRELHVSQAKNILAFYATLFNWQIELVSKNLWQAKNEEGEVVCHIREIENSFKGKFEYWVNIFGVDKLSQTQEKILSNGGSILFKEENKVLCSDASNEAFFYIQEAKAAY